MPTKTSVTAGTAFSQDPPPSPSNLPAFCGWLQRRYIKNDRDKALQDALAEILQVQDDQLLPVPIKVGLTGEARGLLVTAPSGAGKSVLIHRNLERLQRLPSPSGLPDGVLAVTVTGEATLKSLGLELCARSGYPAMRQVATKWQIFEVVRHRIKVLGIGLLWIDEAHHLLVPRRGGDPASDVLRMLKSLLQGESATAVVLSGIPSLEAALGVDPETSRRFGRLRLEPVTGAAGRALVARSIEAYCSCADLRTVDDPFLPDRLLYATDASLGRSMEMTLGAIRHALLGKGGMLRLEDFARVFDRGAEPGATNPFDIPDWEATMGRTVRSRRAAQ